MFKRNEMTPWIRVVQPYTGGGKGFYFVSKDPPHKALRFFSFRKNQFC